MIGVEVGKKYEVRVCEPGMSKSSFRRGRVKVIYKHYVLVKFRCYCECFTKADINTGHVVFEEC